MIAVGGSPESVFRAGALGLPLAIAIIGGLPPSFAPLVGLYRDAARQHRHDPATLPVSINSHAYLADRSQQAADDFFGPYTTMMNRIGRERAWPPITREQFEASRSPRGALLVGSPAEVIEKILAQHELLGTEVAPAVRADEHPGRGRGDRGGALRRPADATTPWTARR